MNRDKVEELEEKDNGFLEFARLYHRANPWQRAYIHRVMAWQFIRMAAKNPSRQSVHQAVSVTWKLNAADMRLYWPFALALLALLVWGWAFAAGSLALYAACGCLSLACALRLRTLATQTATD